MQESYRVIGFLGKMCQQCAKCQSAMEKAMILGSIGEQFLKFEDYFAVELERQDVVLKDEYNQYQRFFAEASEACFDCGGQGKFIYTYAMSLIDSISCKTIKEEVAKKSNLVKFSKK
ncbi:MAG: hypothetical protein WCI36_02230 [bacterium]